MSTENAADRRSSANDCYPSSFDGWHKCEWDTNGELCDRCWLPATELFFGNADYFSGDGDYWCEPCIRHVWLKDTLRST